jgi:hypothetical protein
MDLKEVMAKNLRQARHDKKLDTRKNRMISAVDTATAARSACFSAP